MIDPEQIELLLTTAELIADMDDELFDEMAKAGIDVAFPQQLDAMARYLLGNLSPASWLTTAGLLIAPICEAYQTLDLERGDARATTTASENR